MLITKTINQNHVPRRAFLKGVVAASAFTSLGAAKSRAVRPPWNALSSESDDESYWRMVRSCFPLDTDYHYMNTGFQGPTSFHVLEEMDRIAHYYAEQPATEFALLNEILKEGITTLADFVGADENEVAYMNSTTDGICAVIHSLKLEPGDEILISDREHGAVTGPCGIRSNRDGIVTKNFSTGFPPKNKKEILESVKKAMTPRTRLLCFSHLTYNTNLMLPIQELCELAKSKDVLTLVDGAHPFGMLNLNMHELGCDFYAASGYKWICGPIGAGILYAKADKQDRVHPIIVGGYWDRLEGARKFMARNSSNISGYFGLYAAIKLQEKIGKEKIETRVRMLASRLRTGLTEIPGIKLYTSNDPGLSAGLTSFSVKDFKNTEVLAALNEHYGLYPRTVGGDLNAIRASTHIFNTVEEVDRMIEACREMSAKGLPQISAAALNRAILSDIKC